MSDLYNYVDASSSRKSKLIADDVYEIIMKHKVNQYCKPTFTQDYLYSRLTHLLLAGRI
jgi:hypothetical protein